MEYFSIHIPHPYKIINFIFCQLFLLTTSSLREWERPFFFFPGQQECPVLILNWNPFSLSPEPFVCPFSLPSPFQPGPAWPFPVFPVVPELSLLSRPRLSNPSPKSALTSASFSTKMTKAGLARDLFLGLACVGLVLFLAGFAKLSIFSAKKTKQLKSNCYLSLSF